MVISKICFRYEWMIARQWIQCSKNSVFLHFENIKFHDAKR